MQWEIYKDKSRNFEVEMNMKSLKLKLFCKKKIFIKLFKPSMELIQNNRIQKSPVCQEHKENIIIGHTD